MEISRLISFFLHAYIPNSKHFAPKMYSLTLGDDVGAFSRVYFLIFSKYSAGIPQIRQIMIMSTRSQPGTLLLFTERMLWQNAVKVSGQQEKEICWINLSVCWRSGHMDTRQVWSLAAFYPWCHVRLCKLTDVRHAYGAKNNNNNYKVCRLRQPKSADPDCCSGYAHELLKLKAAWDSEDIHQYAFM